jgi:hypothetical protein
MLMGGDKCVDIVVVVASKSVLFVVVVVSVPYI